MSKVSIARTDQGIKGGVEKAIGLLGGIGQFVARGESVMLKPNLNGADVYTNRDLVAALIEMLRDHGAGRVFIAESTFGNAQTTNMYFQKTGYTELAQRCGVELINLNESQVVEVPVSNPQVHEKIRVAKEVYEADKIINIPSMKVHYATGISLALKNIKGLLVGGEKRHFHEAGLDKSIIDLNSVVKTHLNIIDCTSCMERMGPHGGDVVNLDMLIAGENPAAVDYVGSQVMGYDLSEVNHLRQYAEMHNIDLNDIEVVGEKIDDVKYPFKKVSMERIIPEAIKVHDRNACCVCMNALLISCSLLQGRLTRDVDIHLGSLADEVVSGDTSVAFGNCCVRRMDAGKSIKGCPPYPFALGEVLKDILI